MKTFPLRSKRLESFVKIGGLFDTMLPKIFPKAALQGKG